MHWIIRTAVVLAFFNSGVRALTDCFEPGSTAAWAVFSGLAAISGFGLALMFALKKEAM